jgi:hypothetical protein
MWVTAKTAKTYIDGCAVASHTPGWGFWQFWQLLGWAHFQIKTERGGTAPVCLRPMESPNPPGAVRRLTGSNHPPI